MSLIRNERETQRAFVERTLREHGYVHTYDVLYNTAYPDGRQASVTRLAAIIHTLRSEGWSIDTRDDSGQVATYVLSEAKTAWRCTVCNGDPGHEPSPLLGGLGHAYCLTCNRRQTFRRLRVAA